MSNPKRIVCRLLIAVLAVSFAPRARASAYDAHPKLVVLLMIDQFRGDYLDRYRADFKGRGFNLLLDRGAYFEDCYYDYANTKTAPGHATLATGAYSDGHGISSNEWWDLSRNKQRPVSSVEDGRYRLVGLANAKQSSPGASPFNLRASTLGDSLRLATQGQSEVFGISLKDRSAILPAGFSANGAYWIDPASGAFITSSYYMASLPEWVTTFNTSGRVEQAEQEAGVTSSGKFFETVGRTPAANSYELDFARALITGEQLGQHPVTDLLTISLTANDLVGHSTGPDSSEEHAMIDSLDQQLDSFFTWLDKNIPGGLANVWIAFSADHGVAPVPAEAAQLGMPAAKFDLNKFIASLNDSMNAKFSPGENIHYLLPRNDLPYLSLNQPSFETAGINEQEAEQAILEAVPDAVAALAPAAAQPEDQVAANPSSESPPSEVSGNQKSVNPPAANSPAPAAAQGKSQAAQKASQAPEKQTPAKQTPSANQAQGTAPTNPQPPPPPVKRLPATPVVVHAYTQLQLASGQLPPSEWGRLLAHSYSPNGGWYVMVIPEAYQMNIPKNGTTHFSPWSYDRHVPLAFVGAPFTPGTYRGRVQPVDLAATLSSLLGINEPSACIGTVLTQAIRNVPTPVRRRTSASRRVTHRSPTPSQAKPAPEKERSPQ